jgi:pimeloyl-ACP methyl ester carboxylesterase
VGVLDALGAKDAVIAGHDFGATVAREAALMRPDRFRALISLDVPFRPRGFGTPVRPTGVMPQNGDAMYYQLYLQTPEARKELERDVRRTLRPLRVGTTSSPRSEAAIHLNGHLSPAPPRTTAIDGLRDECRRSQVPKKEGSLAHDALEQPAQARAQRSLRVPERYDGIGEPPSTIASQPYHGIVTTALRN